MNVKVFCVTCLGVILFTQPINAIQTKAISAGIGATSAVVGATIMYRNLATKCNTETTTAKAMYCALEVPAAMQVVNGLGSVVSAFGTASAVKSGGSGSNPFIYYGGGGTGATTDNTPYVFIPDDTPGLTPDQIKQLNLDAKAAQDTLQKALADGTLSSDGSTVKVNGTPVPISSFQSADKLAKAVGASPDQAAALSNSFAQAEQAAKAAMQKFSVAAVPTASDGGGGGGRGGSSSTFGQNDAARGLFANRNPASQNKAALAGLSRSYGDEKIGVAGDDLFSMMSRSYEKKRTQNMFYNTGQ